VSSGSCSSVSIGSCFSVSGGVDSVVVSAGVVAAGVVEPFSSSPPQPEIASNPANRQASTHIRVNFRGQMPIAANAELHNAGTCETR
jgi:hypothetical protein